jgi:glycosyltransferase involved in cell wall biosynthesis
MHAKEAEERSPGDAKGAELSVLLLSRYGRKGASSRLRFLDFTAPLASHGIAVDPRPFFDDDYLEALFTGRHTPLARHAEFFARRFGALRSRRRYHVVWAEKEVLPFLPGLAEVLLLGSTPLVVDFDDAWYLRYNDHPRPLVRRLLSGKLEKVVRSARLTVVGNSVLEDWAHHAGAREVLRLPTVVNMARYPPRASRIDGTPVIGWIGSPTTSVHLEPLRPVFERLLVAGRARLTLVGGGDGALKGLRGVDRRDWSEDREAEDVASFDVGVMPLLDTPWARGKCAYKLIQCMAGACPVVASPVGMNRDVVRDGENGFLADSADRWREALDTLCGDRELRTRMGRAGRELVLAEYSVDAIAPKLAEALRRAAAPG